MSALRMKNRLLALALSMAVALCLVVLPGCGKSTEETIRESLTQELDAFKAADKSELLSDLEGSVKDSFDQLGVDGEKFGEAYLDGFDYELGDITVDEDAGTAKATVSISIKSMNAILTSFTTAYQEWVNSQDTLPGEDELMAQGGKILMKQVKKAKTKKVDVTLTYKKGDDGTWSETDGVADEVSKALMG